VDFDPTRGAEIRKTHPAVLIPERHRQPVESIAIVAAITSHVDESRYPTEVLIARGEGGLQVNSVALLNQLRSIDKARLIRGLGAVTSATLERIDRALVLRLGLARL